MFTYSISAQFADGSEYNASIEATPAQALLQWEKFLDHCAACGMHISAAWLSHGEHTFRSIGA